MKRSENCLKLKIADVRVNSRRTSINRSEHDSNKENHDEFQLNLFRIQNVYSGIKISMVCSCLNKIDMNANLSIHFSNCFICNTDRSQIQICDQSMKSAL